MVKGEMKEVFELEHKLSGLFTDTQHVDVYSMDINGLENLWKITTGLFVDRNKLL